MNLTPEILRAMERKPVHRDPLAALPIEKLAKSTVRDCLTVEITGQIRGGKNSVHTTKTGRRYPNKAWAKWRDAAVREVASQIPKNWRAISGPTNIRMEYWAGDKRRRDMPAIIDAAFHVLEKAGFTEDDTHLWVAESTRSYDKQNPRLTITIIP